MSLKAAEGNDAELENLWKVEVRHSIDEEVKLFPVRGGISLGRARGCMGNHFDHNILAQGPTELKLRKKKRVNDVKSCMRHRMRIIIGMVQAFA